MTSRSDSLALDATAEGVLLAVRVSPGASRARILGIHGKELKLAVREPPERGRANRGVLALLASEFDLPRRRLEVTAGATSRSKRVLFRGVDPADLRSRIKASL